MNLTPYLLYLKTRFIILYETSHVSLTSRTTDVCGGDGVLVYWSPSHLYAWDALPLLCLLLLGVP